MAIGTGLSAQLGYKQETAFGTAVVVDQFNDFNSETLKIEDGWTDPKGLAAGRLVPLAARMTQTTRSVSGDIEMDFCITRMGRLISQALGSSLAPTSLGGGAMQQVHQIGDQTGKSLTFQVGRPQTDGTIKPFTASGCKITDWEISSSTGELVTLKLGIDGKDFVTTIPLSTASYAPAAGQSIFNHQQAMLSIGTGVTTASGVMTLAGEVPLGDLVDKISVKGTNGLATERFGTSKTKNEQLQNDMFAGEISLDTELSGSSGFYDLWRGGNVRALRINYVGDMIGTSGGFFGLEIIASAVKITDDDVSVGGPDIVPQGLTLKVLSDGVNNPLQVRIVTTDSSL